MPDAVSHTLAAIADVSVTMREMASWWREKLGAPSGDSVMRVRRERGRNDDASTPHDVGAGLNLSWHAEVDGRDGRTITGALEAWYDGEREWLVESTVMSTGHDSFEVLMESGSEFLAESHRLADVLQDHARRLDTAKEEALEAFLRCR
jgi:hypothetical protein